MKRNILRLLILLSMLATGCQSHTTTKTNQPSFNSDYYKAFVNNNGTLKFVNKSTGATIIDNAPRYYFNYDKSAIKDISPTNASFEVTDSNNLPDGWAVDKDYINQTVDYASDGLQSLEFDMKDKSPDHRRAYSSLIKVDSDKTYSISVDSYYGSSADGLRRADLFVSYYTNADGTGKANIFTDVYILVPYKLGSWTTSTLTWSPPFEAKSFKVLLYVDKNDVSTLYFDNIKVSEITNIYATNGDNIISNTSPSGDVVTVQSTDDSNPEVTVVNRYDMNIHSPNITYTGTITYKQSVTVTEERFDFKVPAQTASVMTRDLKLINFDITKEYYTDSYTPKVAKFSNGLSFLGTDTMQSMRLRVNNSDSQISFYSDYELNHPFQYWTKNGVGGTLNITELTSGYVNNNGGPMVDISTQKRMTGDSYSVSITFSISPGTNPKSLVKTRQPHGYDATLLFTNHPDQETTARIEAIAYGTEDSTSPDYGTKGIVGRKIGWTKGVFVTGTTDYTSKYATLEDTVFKALTDKMSKDGVEIVGHSITDETDSRDTVDKGMATLAQYGTEDWIDHGAMGGKGNWEDLASQGTIKGDPNYALDLFAKYNYKYAWSFFDYQPENYGLNILSPTSTNKKTSFFYYNSNVDNNPGQDNKIYLWSTINTNKTPDLYYTNANVDSLIAQRGIHIGHEYLGYKTTENHVWYTNLKTGKIEIYPTFDSELTYIAAKREAGLLWTPTMAELGDYLVLLPNVMVVDNFDGSYTITNGNPIALSGLTLLSESSIKSATINDAACSSFGGSYGANELVIPLLNAWESIKVTLN